MNIELIGNRVAFEKVDLQVKTASGIILGTHTAQADHRDIGYGKVIAVGPEVKQVQVDDIIAVNDRQPLQAMYRGEALFIIRDHDIIFISKDADLEVSEYQTSGNEFIDPITKRI